MFDIRLICKRDLDRQIFEEPEAVLRIGYAADLIGDLQAMRFRRVEQDRPERRIERNGYDDGDAGKERSIRKRDPRPQRREPRNRLTS